MTLKAIQACILNIATDSYLLHNEESFKDMPANIT